MAGQKRHHVNHELTEQIKLFNWARANAEYIPELALLYHVPNEGKRHNGGLLVRAGLKSGVPDICLPVARRGFNALYIEMKWGSNKATKSQQEFIRGLDSEDNKVAICYSFEEARAEIRHYLARADNFDLVNCEEAQKWMGKCCGHDYEWAPCRDCAIYCGDIDRG